jgi:hypothetical protein
MAVAFKLPAVISPRESAVSRPHLSVVAKPERWYMKIMFTVASIVVMMFLVVSLRAHMAQQEMRLDKLNYDISRAREHFETLRAQRANMQSPELLIAQARTIGLVPSVGTRLVDVPAATAAEVAATVGKVDSDVIAHTESPLDEFGRMKATTLGAP